MRHRHVAWRRAINASVCAALLVGCTGSDDDTVLVLAAASLTDAMGELADEFEARNPGVTIELSVAGSNALRTQIVQGAPADVVAFADAAPMEQLVATGDVDANDVVVFAHNQVVLATPIDNPGSVFELADVARDDLAIGVCAPAVPCGDLAAEWLARSGIAPAADTEEPDVRSLVAKLVAGELDAAVVYATDVQAFADDLAAVEVGDVVPAINDYPIAALNDSEHAAAFVDFVRSEDGADVLRDAGFTVP